MNTILLLLAVVATAQAQSAIADEEVTKLIKSTFPICQKSQKIQIDLGVLINAKDISVRRLVIHQPPNFNEKIPNPPETNPQGNPPETSTIETVTPSEDPDGPGLKFPPSDLPETSPESDDKVNEIFNETPLQNPTSTPSTPTVSSSTIRTVITVPTIPTLSTPATTSNQPTEPAPSSNVGDCVCVPFDQCYQGKLNEDGVNMMLPRINVCDSAKHVCCQKTNIITPSPPKNDLCGTTKHNNDDFGNRILTQDDGETEYGEFPWIAAILNVQDKSYQCGGSLVHPQVVLTAAHCVENSTEFIVRLGDWNSQTDDEPHAYQDKKVVKTVHHPEFTVERMRHDSALLFLNSSVISAPNIGTICLPESTDVFNGSRCFVAGWGKDHYGRTGVYRAILKKVDVPIVNHTTCQNILGQAGGMGSHFKLHSSFMCAGGEVGKDACTGDGGGPLMCPHRQDPARYTQAGVVSWGRGCGKQNVPGVYANTATDRQWIDQQLKENSALIAQN